MSVSLWYNSYFFASIVTSAEITFARIIDSSSGTEVVNETAVDSSDNVYMAGLYTGTPVIKNQAGVTLTTLPASSGGSCAFVCKFNSSGNFQYARIIDTTGSNESYGVSCDSLGNLYISGYYSGTPTIKDQAGTSLGTLPISAGGTAAFMCKFY